MTSFSVSQLLTQWQKYKLRVAQETGIIFITSFLYLMPLLRYNHDYKSKNKDCIVTILELYILMCSAIHHIHSYNWGIIQSSTQSTFSLSMSMRTTDDKGTEDASIG